MTDGMILNCLVHGETLVDRVFTVKVAKSETVKDVIKDRLQPAPAFNQTVPPNSLCKVSFPLDNSVDKMLKQLVLEDNATRDAQKLYSAKKLSSYFTDEAAEEHLHVIVEPPSVAVESVSKKPRLHKRFRRFLAPGEFREQVYSKRLLRKVGQG